MNSPFSSQALNLGIGGAVNLGWKLAATVQGWVPQSQLGTYLHQRTAPDRRLGTGLDGAFEQP